MSGGHPTFKGDDRYFLCGRYWAGFSFKKFKK
jgi:hypothetical protein